MKRIMILGGGTCQLSALQKAKALGLETLVADMLPEAPGAVLADHYALASTFDPEACQKAAEDFQVDGIMTLGTDQPVLTAALTAEAMGLPTLIRSSQARALTNKREMKALLQKKKIPTVDYCLVDGQTDFNKMEERFPGSVVLKPLDSQGQRGVYRLEKVEQASSMLKKTLSYSREKQALLEAYYPSDEITVSGWVKGGELTILTVTDRVLMEDSMNIGICTSHRFPTIHQELKEEIREISRKVAEAFELEEGPFYLQLLAGEKGVLVNEAAFRIGGAFEDSIIPKISGFDILDAVMAHALGEKPRTTWKEGYDCFQTEARASVQLMFAHPGQIREITPVEELLALEDVVDAGYNVRPGQWIKSAEDATARLGYCVFFRESGDLTSSLEAFRETFRVLDDQGHNLYRKFPKDAVTSRKREG